MSDQSMMLRRLLAVSTALGALCAGSAALAEPGAAAAAPTPARADAAQQGQAGNGTSNEGQGSAGASDEQEIIVTAEKRPQLLINVPQSISAVSGGTLEAQHATNFQDYLKLVPGLQLNQDTPGEGRLIVRGVNTGGVASTVSVYVDDTPFGSSSGLVNGAVLAGDFDTFDLDRIEVLRGPQGTLYGASSLSGVLRFITNDPSTGRFEFRGRAGLESVDDGGVGYNANALVNVPLGPTLAFRASGSYRKDAGFIDSIGTGGSDVARNINGDRVYGGRASLLFKPSAAVSIRLTAIAQNIDADEPTLIEADSVTLQPLHGLSESQFVPQFSNLHYRVYNGTGTFDLGFGKLTTSTSFSKQDQNTRSDLTVAFSGLIAPLVGPNEFIEPQQTNLTKFTQEARLSGEGRFADWLVGGFYTHEKGLIGQDLIALQPGTLTPLTLPSFLAPTLGHLTLISTYREIAGFANATVHITQAFDLQFGGRYSQNHQSADQATMGALAGGTTDTKNTSSEHVFTYSVAPKFKLNSNTTLYARVAKGFRPGGPNVIAPNAPPQVPRTYGSDSVISWEAGLKMQSADHRFTLDAAAFHIDWKDIQLFTTVVANGVPFGVNINGSGAKSDGAELTATARPLAGLELSLNGAYTDARLTDDTPATVGGRKGDPLPFTPKFSAAANADYHWQLSSAVRAHVGASLRHLSGQTGPYDAAFVAAQGRQRHIPAYNVLDLGAGVNFGHFDLEAFVKNLGNSRGITSVAGTATPIFPNGAIGTGIIRPRTIGLSLGFNY
ncbi:MAG TPA: TonB-dependent receptor [Allosphingosinicella sp.]|nr:TonB-dependent receptor [Allosphingosinicella sp.]